MNPFITAAKARHDVLSVVYKGMAGTGKSDTNQLLAVLAGMYAIATVIEDMEKAEQRKLLD